MYPTPVRLTPTDHTKIHDEALARIATIAPSHNAWDEGMAWYQRANQFCRDLGEIVSQPWDRLTWALAALSPLNSWRLNRIDLVDMVTTGDCGALGPNRVKAQRLLEGEGYESVLGGNKVLAFGHNVTHPEDSTAVTIDGHMVKALALPNHKYIERVGVYDTIVRAMTEVADAFGVLPHQLQAAMWVETRGSAT